MNMPVQQVGVNPNLNARVEQYVKLRDKIRDLEEAHKKAVAPYKETLEQLNSALLQALTGIQGDSVRTAHGTVYKTIKRAASIADASAFWTYVVATGEFDLLDKRVNVKACADFIEAHKTPPPGVNYNETQVVGVRRS